MEEHTIRKGMKRILPDGTKIPDISPVTIVINESEGIKPKRLTEEDVWGMIVARSEELCPYFGDKLPYKSVTIVCKKEEEKDATYWLEYVHGANCVSKVKEIGNEMVAIRSDYQCW